MCSACAAPTHLSLQSSLLTWLEKVPQILQRDLQGILMVAIYKFECLPNVMVNNLFSHEKNPEEDKYL